MAYPDKIKETGPLPGSEAFEFFLGAIMDTTYNPEMWPWYEGEPSGPLGIEHSFFNGQGAVVGPLPWSRSTFYGYIGSWTFTSGTNNENAHFWFKTIDGSPLYNYSSPQSGWPVSAVNDWAKIKSIELALFGSIGNGGNLSDMTDVGSGTLMSRIPTLKRYDLGYLRYALVRFPNYDGDFVSDDNYVMPAPTNPTHNISSRTFGWTNAPGYGLLSDYEYFVNGSLMGTPASNPVHLDDYSLIPAGGVQVRVKEKQDTYRMGGASLLSTVSYPSVPMDITVTLTQFSGVGDITVSTLTPTYETDIDVEVYMLINGGGSVEELTLPAGESSVLKPISYPPFFTISIQNVIVIPTSIGDRSINVQIIQ